MRTVQYSANAAMSKADAQTQNPQTVLFNELHFDRYRVPPLANAKRRSCLLPVEAIFSVCKLGDPIRHADIGIIFLWIGNSH